MHSRAVQLADLGFDAFFESAMGALDRPELRPARVVRADRGQYRIHDGQRIYGAEAAGKLLYAEESLPAVGDWVAADLADESLAVIHERLERRSAFVRGRAGRRLGSQCVAANIDTLFITTSADRDFNQRRIERYQVVAARSGAEPVIVINKADLDELEPEERVEQAGQVAPHVAIVLVSAHTGAGVAELDPYLVRGRTVAFVGSSGVGKSTLINALLGEERISTREVRTRDGRGQHTTSHRELFLLPDRAAVIDTPGMRELRLWCEHADLHAGFPDIELLAEECRFRDCVHESEPGCAVAAAAESGELEPARLGAWHKLRAEMRHTAERYSELGNHEERKRGRRFGRMVKEMKRIKGKDH